MRVSLLGLVLVLGAVAAKSATKLQEKFNWKLLDYAYPDEQSRQHALRTGEFVPENGIPVGIEIWKDKLFVTVPRWRKGIPSTLNYIPLHSDVYTKSPALIPYPDWSTNREGNCAGVTTTYRIKADACDRLWVLDSGTLGIENTTTQLCPYGILVFDLKTDRLIRRYDFKPEDTNDRTFIANIAVDIGKTCDDTFVYASDELGHGLLVYSWEQNTSWRVEHGYFHPDPLKGDFNIAGLNFQWFEEGIFGIALSPLKNDGYRTLFFNPLASNRQFAVSTMVLRHKELAQNSYHAFVPLAERGPKSHLTANFMDDFGMMFFNLIDQNAIGCWDSSRHPYDPKYLDVVDRDDVGLVFPSDVKVDRNYNLWVISDRMPVFLVADALDKNDINFRIYSAPIFTALRGTVCDPNTQFHYDDVRHGVISLKDFYE
ncbi:protein yellow-like [Periplaneta americana]